MATRALTLDDVNLLDHDMFAEREPWDVFELLQREAPVFRHPEPDGAGFWCVTRYDDVVQVLKDTQTFSSESGGAALIEPGAAADRPRAGGSPGSAPQLNGAPPAVALAVAPALRPRLHAALARGSLRR